MTLSPRIETGRPMLLAGIRRHHRFADAVHTVPAQWDAFVALDDIPGRIGETAYGAMCRTDLEAQTYEYMCAVEVESFESLPEDLGRMRVPAAHYAVFTHEGPVSAIKDTWRAIWTEWVPASGFKPGDTPDFELYDERFDAETGSGIVEIWFPIDDAPTG